MCSSAYGGIQMLLFSTKPKRTRVRVLRLSSVTRLREEKIGKDMELKNLKLYMENINLHEENEKLRKKACLLHEENLALLAELQKRSLQCDFVSMAPNTRPEGLPNIKY